MKILMVNDCAFVGRELGSELRRRGYKVAFDSFDKSKRGLVRFFALVKRLRETDCDLLHVHYLGDPALAGYLSRRSYILHCHGSDLRLRTGRLRAFFKKRSLRKAKRTLVSTRDLLRYVPSATYLPTPIDQERFKPNGSHKGRKVLYFPRPYEDYTQKLQILCDLLGYQLTTPRFYSVPYEEFHHYLNGFDVFIDQRTHKAFSKTGLEAMACGLVVVTFCQDLERALLQALNLQERKAWLDIQRKHILPGHNVLTVVDQLERVYHEF